MFESLRVYPENMEKNLNQHKGLYNSQRILLELTDRGLSREKAYALVQKHAMKVWEEGQDFYAELVNDADVTKLIPEKDLKNLFDLSYHTKHVDTIFKRVFQSGEKI